jgi:ABC-type transport system involved in multi-copper enzyme maturation permease subunit
MKSLLWEEYRQNRQLLILVGLSSAIPYVGALVAYLYAHLSPYAVEPLWEPSVHEMSGLAMIVTFLACALIGGNAIAGERVNRSAEFTFYLPISRQSAWLAKTLVAVAACTTLCIIHTSVSLVSFPGNTHDMEFLFIILSVCMMSFGSAWLSSSLLNSPAIASVLGITVAPVYGVHWERILTALALPTSETAFGISATALGLVCFAVGSLRYLRRVEP